MRRYPYTIILLVSLAAAAVVLSVQLPFAYYSADNVFHIAKILAARDGEFTVDPVTGYTTVYPPLFHTVFGLASRVFALNGFQVARLIQVVDFVGLFLSTWLLAGVILRDREKGALCALTAGLLFYAPTGKYFFLQNPYNFSVIFCLLGTALMVHFYLSGRLSWGIIGGVLFGIGVNIWWWNILPLSGLLLGLLLMRWPGIHSGRKLGRWLLVGSAAAATAVYSLAVFINIRDILPLYNYDIQAVSYAGGHSTIAVVAKWLGDFALRNNIEFFKHLVPAALASSSKVVILYAIAASIHYYLLVLPFNLVVIFLAGRFAIQQIRLRQAGAAAILAVAAAVTLLGSIVALYGTDPSVMGRIQFYCYLFMLPAFFQYIGERFAGRMGRRLKYAIVVLGVGVMLFVVVYRFSLDINDPLPEPTREVVRWIESRPGHAHTRIFMTGYDALILAREVRFQGFTLDYFHPIYFRLDKVRADSVYAAYQSIVAGDGNASFWLEKFNTRYAIVGKRSVNISPVLSRVTENELSAAMLEYFPRQGDLVFENDYWNVYEMKPGQGKTLR